MEISGGFWIFHCLVFSPEKLGYKYYTVIPKIMVIIRTPVIHGLYSPTSITCNEDELNHFGCGINKQGTDFLIWYPIKNAKEVQFAAVLVDFFGSRCCR